MSDGITSAPIAVLPPRREDHQADHDSGPDTEDQQRDEDLDGHLTATSARTPTTAGGGRAHRERSPQVAMIAPASAPALRAAKYRRVSTLEQARTGYSLDAQDRDLDRLAAELGAAVVAGFEDQDSGAEWDLPGLNALLAAAKRREFDILLVYDIDRLARSMSKQLVLEEELKRCGVTIRYATLRLGDSDEDRLLKNMRASIAEYERAKIALRTTRGRRAKAEQGMIVGNGWAPYGYRFVYETDARTGKTRVVSLEPDPVTAPIVRRIFAEVAYLSLNRVCDRLNADGIITYFAGKGRATGRWRDTTLLSILTNPVYLGTAAYGRRDTNKRRRAPETWLSIAVPPLVDRAAWDAASRGLQHRRDRRQAQNPALADAYELRGHLTCGHCDGALAAVPNNGYRYYRCLRCEPSRAAQRGQPVCSLPSVPGWLLDAEAWERVAATLLDPDHLAAGLEVAHAQHSEADQRQRDRLATVDREVARLRTRFDRITDERLDAPAGSETERALKAKAQEVEAAINRLLADRAQLAAVPTPGLSAAETMQLRQFAAEVREGIEHATAGERRRIYELLRLEGTVRLDSEHGIKLGRRHRFAIEWAAIIPLVDDAREYKKTRVAYFTDDYADWERKFLGEVKINLEGLPMKEPAAATASLQR
jgi:site-specific DNA recombinase